ncbi:hypothetical protein C8F01DRAFT_1244056 [Mycena amicta]|nr:hypothetical protein C8F01DRAFT_1244056 [Mycena amicta]
MSTSTISTLPRRRTAEEASPSASFEPRPAQRQRVDSSPLSSQSAPAHWMDASSSPLAFGVVSSLLAAPAVSAPLNVVHSLVDVAAPAPDLHFYRPDGNCVLLVDDTLFKIHRHYLVPDTDHLSLFGPLLAQAAKDSKEDKDERPIVLKGDTADELRAYLRFNYSGPLQLLDENLTQNDLGQLAVAGRFAHKYRLESFKRWVKLIIVRKLRNGTILHDCPPETYFELLQFDRVCSTPEIMTGVQSAWIRNIFGGDCKSVAPELELTAARDMRSFLGELYYAQLCAFDLKPPAILSLHTPIHLDRPGLNDQERLRLLQGHHSLSFSFQRIVDQLLRVQRCSSECKLDASHHCHDQWRNAVLKM